MTRRRSKRELERAIEELTGESVGLDDRDCCDGCGGLLDQSDAGLGVTAPFVTFGCTCDDETDAGTAWPTPGGGSA